MIILVKSYISRAALQARAANLYGKGGSALRCSFARGWLKSGKVSPLERIVSTSHKGGFPMLFKANYSLGADTPQRGVTA